MDSRKWFEGYMNSDIQVDIKKKRIFASSLQFFIFKIVNNYKIVCGYSEKKILEIRNTNHKTSQSPISAVAIYTLY